MSAPLDPAGFAHAPLNRREALRLLALGLTAGVAGCKPGEDIVPAARNLSGLPVGEPLQFATSLPLGGYGRGVLATSVDGRPIKVSGNPAHPASLGSTDLFAEADILGLYDPDSSRTPVRDGLIANWQAFIAELRPRLAALRTRGGEGLALLTGNVGSPTLRRQLDALARDLPRMRRYRHEPIGDGERRAGAALAFGRPLDVVPRLERADVLLCLGADPLGAGPDQLRNADGFRQRRTVRAGQAAMQRIYAVESSATLTGTMADHRRSLSPARILAFAAALGSRFGGPPVESEAADAPFLDALAADLRGAGARGLVLVGEEQPPALHALGHWLNARLGAFGTTLDLVEPIDGGGEAIGTLATELAAGRVDTLVILGGNPAYDAPADLGFAALIPRAGFAVHLGVYRDETGHACRWHLAETHPLEAWGDLRAVDGTAGIAQPLIRPLYAGVSAPEVLAALGGDETAKAYDLVRETWEPAAPAGPAFESWWLRAVESGIVPGTAAASVPPPREPPFPALPQPPVGDGLTLLLRPDPTIYDGRYGNNAWAQECPKPVTHETWGNALRIAPVEAAQLGIAAESAVRIEAGGRAIEAPVILDRRQAAGTVSLSLGYGRDKAGAIGIGLGANAYALRRSDALWALAGVRLTVTGTSEPLPLTQVQIGEDGRDLAPETALAALAAASKPEAEPPATFYPPQSYEAPYRGPGEDYAWAMVIDTSLCIGCNACVVACQAENNVPVVGPDEIRAGRTMHWLRIDAYEKADAEARTVFQPVPCMHCENAPCEPVCPVGASVHDHEGLNVQVYNRCVGTRFCQANCPYKVRRFNFFGYADGQEYGNLGNAPTQARFNPDVTVRGRGVMEKCTYCVQRIAGARQAAERDDRRLTDGEVVTACQAACPTKAIGFGDLSAENSRVAALRGEPQHYALLEEVGTKPRTTYLARVRNAHPGLDGDGS